MVRMDLIGRRSFIIAFAQIMGNHNGDLYITEFNVCIFVSKNKREKNIITLSIGIIWI